MAEMNGVFMDVPAVRNIAKNFNTISTVLKNVCKVLEMLSNTLKATAFIGMVGGLALAHFIDTIRPYIEQVAQKCEELFQDLNASVDAFERGDALGATRFY